MMKEYDDNVKYEFRCDVDGDDDDDDDDDDKMSWRQKVISAHILIFQFFFCGRKERF